MCQTRRGPQPLHQVAGSTVGHVPANLCRAFSQLNDLGLIQGRITARARGVAQQSQTPPVHARFQRGACQGRQDQPGGGGGGGYHVPIDWQFEVANCSK